MSEKTVGLGEKINVAAYFLSQRNIPYDILCWQLSERQLYTQNNNQYAPNDMIKKRAAEIFFSAISYDVLCWLIAKLDILHGKETFNKRPGLIL